MWIPPASRWSCFPVFQQPADSVCEPVFERQQGDPVYWSDSMNSQSLETLLISVLLLQWEISPLKHKRKYMRQKQSLCTSNELESPNIWYEHFILHHSLNSLRQVLPFLWVVFRKSRPGVLMDIQSSSLHVGCFTASAMETSGHDWWCAVACFSIQVYFYCIGRVFVTNIMLKNKHTTLLIVLHGGSKS